MLFSDCDELIDWLNVRIDSVNSEWNDGKDYLVQRKMVLKLQNLQREIKANADRIGEVVAVGK